jgi:hypothetical protein
LELLALPKAYLKTYVMVDGWLYKKPCKDCAKKEDGAPHQVLDMSTLLTLKGKTDVGYYCNFGVTGHKMNMEDEPLHKQQWTCDMVLCQGCYDKRKQTMGDDGGNKRN